jgi:hypothetical protein
LNQRALAGVFAKKDFDEGDLIIKDEILVGAQHSLNKVRLLIKIDPMYACFRFLCVLILLEILYLFYVFCCRLTVLCVVIASASLVL